MTQGEFLKGNSYVNRKTRDELSDAFSQKKILPSDNSHCFGNVPTKLSILNWAKNLRKLNISRNIFSFIIKFLRVCNEDAEYFL